MLCFPFRIITTGISKCIVPQFPYLLHTSYEVIMLMDSFEKLKTESDTKKII